MDTSRPEILPITACKRLAQMFNAIEKGASWPNAESVARAALWPKSKEWS